MFIGNCILLAISVQKRGVQAKHFMPAHALRQCVYDCSAGQFGCYFYPSDIVRLEF